LKWVSSTRLLLPTNFITFVSFLAAIHASLLVFYRTKIGKKEGRKEGSLTPGNRAEREGDNEQKARKGAFKGDGTSQKLEIRRENKMKFRIKFISNFVSPNLVCLSFPFLFLFPSFTPPLFFSLRSYLFGLISSFLSLPSSDILVSFLFCVFVGWVV
jgi:hypothetical protein